MAATASAIRAEHRAESTADVPSPVRRSGAPDRPDVRAAGNLAVQRLHVSRLTVGSAGDATEREADQVARRVTGGQAVGHQIAPMCGGCAEEEKKQAPGSVVRTLARPGSPLPQPVRRDMEASFGRSFGDVRLHADAEAAQSAAAIDARAYTHGSDVVLGAAVPPLTSSAGKGVLAHELTHVVQQTAPGGSIRRDLLDDASAAFNSAVSTVTETASDIGAAVTDAVSNVGAAVTEAVTEGVTDLGALVGVPAPGDGSPTSLRLILDVAENPVVSAVTGQLLPGTVPLLRDTLQTLDVAWEILQHPEPYSQQIQEGLGGMIADAGPLATKTATAAVPAAAAQDGWLDCVWRHLEPKIDYVMANGRTVLWDMAWDLVWPWPGVAEDFGHAWDSIKAAGSHLWALEINAAYDDLLAVLRYVNAAAGRLSLWLLLASVLVGGVLGGLGGLAVSGPGFWVGAGTGAAVGLAFATGAGLALLGATLIIEGASISKAALNLAIMSRTPEQRECDCEIIASSSLTVGLTLATALLGGLAATFGKAIAARMFNRVFRRPIMRGGKKRTAGDVVADRYAWSELVKAGFNQRRVTITDVLSRAENFRGLDLTIGSIMRVVSQTTGTVLNSASALRAAFRNHETIRVEVNGGNIVQVKAHGPTPSLVKQIRAEIKDISTFNQGVYSGNTVVVTNPTQRTLVVFLHEAMSTADETAVRAAAAAAQPSVVLELIVGGMTSSHPAVVVIEAIPAILAEIGAEAGREGSEPVPEGTSPAPCP